MSYYKSENKQAIFLLAALYDSQQLAKSGDGVTKHWAKPEQDVDGAWLLPKPESLECSTIGQCVGDEVEVVESVEWPQSDPR